ncbi:MAG: PocR ligand-binding domain-containing protein [Lentisphaeria bacterium]|nr:PocR ligand-binding domain-containing protein [Lentisphaeria bacterium]
MSQNLSFNLILKERVQKLLDDFATVMNVHIVFFDPDGVPLRRGRGEECSFFCKKMQKEYFSYSDCCRLDSVMEKKCAASGKCESYICHASLGESVMPVVAPGGLLLGFLMFGQYRCQKDLPSFLLKKAEGKGERDTVIKAYEALPYYNDEAVKKMSGLLEVLVDYIVKCELVTSGEDHLFTALNEYISQHFREKLTVTKAAKEMGKSVSSLSHCLRANHHPSFVELLTMHRLAHAEKLLRESPQMRIGEIANECGYPDPYYFSRIFKKYKKVPPGKYGKRVGLAE